ncbi:MAG: phosphotransferase family protein [Ktedonobacterales bacterium]
MQPSDDQQPGSTTSPVADPAPMDPRKPDTTRLYTFLCEHLLSDDEATTQPLLAVELLPFGYSNLTYRVRLGQRELILRRPPVGANVRSGHDMSREYRVLSALTPIYTRVPRPLVYCDDPAIFGAPFYVMERVEGVILRRPLPDGLSLAPETIRAVSEAFVDNFVAIHALDWANTDLKQLGHPEGYTQRQVAGWRERYARARTEDIPGITQIEAWLDEHIPSRSDAALIHNDYKYDNLILAPQHLPTINAVLDWEMATLGDPLTDLGTTLAYWIDPNDPGERHDGLLDDGLTTLPGNLSRSDLAQRYATQSRRDLGEIVFYFVFGLYKNTVIAQQIHARYVKGLIPDPRFGRFLPAIHALTTTALRAIEKNRIDELG